MFFSPKFAFFSEKKFEKNDILFYSRLKNYGIIELFFILFFLIFDLFLYLNLDFFTINSTDFIVFIYDKIKYLKKL